MRRVSENTWMESPPPPPLLLLHYVTQHVRFSTVSRTLKIHDLWRIDGIYVGQAARSRRTPRGNTLFVFLAAASENASAKTTAAPLMKIEPKPRPKVRNWISRRSLRGRAIPPFARTIANGMICQITVFVRVSGQTTRIHNTLAYKSTRVWVMWRNVAGETTHTVWETRDVISFASERMLVFATTSHDTHTTHTS